MALVSVSARPKVVCGLTSHSRTLRDALESVSVVDGPTPLSDAVVVGAAVDRRVRAGASLRGERRRRLGVGGACARTGCRMGRSRHSGGECRYHPFSGSAQPVGPIAYQTLLEVTNAADLPVECRLTLTLADELVDVVPLRFAAGETVSRVFDSVSATGGNSLRNWSTRMLWRPTTGGGRGARAQARAGSAFDPSEFVSGEGDRGQSARSVGGDEGSLNRQTGRRDGLSPRGPKVLPPGPVFVIDPRQGCDQWEVGEVVPSRSSQSRTRTRC